MKNVRLLLAGPGTGKTTKVKSEVKKYDPKKVLVLSYTNATIHDLLTDFEKDKIKIDSSRCMTLHGYALKINHIEDRYVLDSYEEKILEFYAQLLKLNLEEFCTFTRAITFEYMIKDCLNFIRENPAYAHQNIGDIDLLVVDEFQDFNVNDRELISAISDHAVETLILGDDDQSIYEFRNAKPEGIIQLYEDVGITRVKHENMCHRCPQDVVLGLNNLIKNNQVRVEKTMIATNDRNGLNAYNFVRDDETNNFVLSTMREILKENPKATMMVLSPVKDVVKSLMEFLELNKFNYDSWLSDKKGNFAASEFRWWVQLLHGRNTLISVLFLLYSKIKKSPTKLTTVVTIMEKHFLHEFDELLLIKELLELGYLDNALTLMIDNEFDSTLLKEKFPEMFKNNEIEDLKGESILEKISHSRKIKNDSLTPGVPCFMSIHKSKGLQADYVFVLGLVSGILPNDSRSRDEIEKQRRELYVAASRVRIGLYLISQTEWSASMRYKYGRDAFKFQNKKTVKVRQSSFINEMLHND